MKKHFLLILFILCMGIALAENDTNDAIYVWIDGSTTCYKLESMPQVTYNNGCAILTLSGKNKPELTLPLTDNAQLIITFGTYQNTVSIKDAQLISHVTKSGKYISGGRLVIIKDCKQYNSNGIIIK